MSSAPALPNKLQIDTALWQSPYPAPRSWAEKAYRKLIHYNRLPEGGHFAAFEQPKLFSEEVRVGFRPLRKEGAKAA